jgi:indole-3-glycerol phosphate synthase
LTSALDTILESTRRSLPSLRERAAELRHAARVAAPAPTWQSAFAGSQVSVIAEVKRRSPSMGAVAPQLDPARRARAYADGGAAAVSVLTEPTHFGGSVCDLEAVAKSVAVPVLRKDFVVDPLQVYEARAIGASAVLLIVRALDPGLLAELVALARELGLGQLVEVHDAEELGVAVSLAPEVIGVNSRDLRTLTVDPETLRTLLPLVPQNAMAVAESGLATRRDVERAAVWGADGVLVGAALSAAQDPEAAVRALSAVSRRGR